MNTKPTPRRRRRPAQQGDPSLTVNQSAEAVAAVAPAGSALRRDELDEAILRFLRRRPNEYVDLTPLAEELAIDPLRMQLAVERLHQRRLLTAPFIEPGSAGGGQLTEVGLRWLIEREGGRPKDVPVALKPASGPVRAADEAARLPRAQVYGPGAERPALTRA
ncbi:MAG: hypothetical protein M3R49_00300 [Chloroflexota bacterium]|nr:hypothetical protein [Chloroflexota bacterium]